MGFRTGSYATVWSVEPVSNTVTRGRISTSRKNKQSGEYETDFSGFVSFVGTAAAGKAANLKERDRIRLGDVDVTYRYIKETEKGFTNFNIFSFEMADEGQRTRQDTPIDIGEPFEAESDSPDPDLPF